MQDVPTFARQNGFSFRDYLDERFEAVLDAEHCVRLNYEAFLFGDPWSRERFLADPTDFCGLLTDPVSKQRFRPTADSASARHEGVTYYFESESTRTRFEDEPERYSLPGWTM